MQSISPIQNQDWALNTVIPGIAGLLTANIDVHLFTAGPGTITQFTEVADFTEATFAAYAKKVLAVATDLEPAISPNANAAVMIGNCVWIAGAVVLPGETILGYYVTDSTDAILYFSEYFAEPVEVTALGQVIDLLISLPFLMVGSLA